MNIRIISIFVIILSLGACKEEVDKVITPDDPIENSSCDYAPFTIGSSFIYQKEQDGEITNQTWNITEERVIDGESYVLLDNFLGQGDTAFIRCDSGSYIAFVPKLEDFDNVFLTWFIETSNPGDIWESELSSEDNGQLIRYVYTVEYIGIESERKVLENTFVDVRHMELNLYILIGDGRLHITTDRHYWKEGIGLIETSGVSNLKLISWDIK
jgi:hypothetical protein